MPIAYKKFSESIQALRYTPKEGEQCTQSIGMMEPGTHDFGNATRKEAISVTSGAITINRILYTPSSGECIIEPGEHVIFEAKVASSYVCTFPH